MSWRSYAGGVEVDAVFLVLVWWWWYCCCATVRDGLARAGESTVQEESGGCGDGCGDGGDGGDGGDNVAGRESDYCDTKSP